MEKETKKQAEQEFERHIRLMGLLRERGLDKVIKIVPKRG